MSKNKSLVKFILALLLILVLGGANLSCALVKIGPGGEITVDFSLRPGGQPPTINLFFARPSSITLGNNSTIEWDVSGATEVSIDQGIGSVVHAGSVEVSPMATATFTLTANNAAGSVTQSFTIEVTSPPATSPPATLPPTTLPPTTLPPTTLPPTTLPPTTLPPTTLPVILSLTASPSSISPGGNSNLSWNVTGATSVNISPGIGSRPASGSAPVSPASTTIFTLSATNAAGTVTQQVTVTVAAAPPPPPSGDAATCEQALFDAVNALRTANGRPALTRNAYIDGLCQTHAQYMATANTLSHDNFSTRCSSIWASIPGMHACAENVLQNNVPCDANAMAQQWFTSPGHNANMLNAAYTISGMGIVIDGSGKIWACQIFAGP